jgi:hypothetical protein
MATSPVAAVYTVVVESSPSGSPQSGHMITQVMRHGAPPMAMDRVKTASESVVTWDRMRNAAGVIFGSAEGHPATSALSRSPHSVSVSPSAQYDAEIIREELARLAAEMAGLKANSEATQYNTSMASSPAGYTAVKVVNPKARVVVLE